MKDYWLGKGANICPPRVAHSCCCFGSTGEDYWLRMGARPMITTDTQQFLSLLLLLRKHRE